MPQVCKLPIFRQILRDVKDISFTLHISLHLALPHTLINMFLGALYVVLVGGVNGSTALNVTAQENFTEYHMG